MGSSIKAVFIHIYFPRPRGLMVLYIYMNNITQTLKVILLAIIISFGISYAFAWVAPTGIPTTGNIEAPLNTSIDEQTKNGNLWLNSLGVSSTAPNALSVLGRVRIGPNDPLFNTYIDDINAQFKIFTKGGDNNTAELAIGNIDNGWARIDLYPSVSSTREASIRSHPNIGDSLQFWTEAIDGFVKSMSIDIAGDVVVDKKLTAENLETNINTQTTDNWPLVLRNWASFNAMNYDLGIKLRFGGNSGNDPNKWVGIKAVLEANWANKIGLAFYTQPVVTTPPVEALRISGDGNVGIGITNPQSRLDIEGDLRIKGSKICYYSCYTSGSQVLCDKKRFDTGATVTTGVYMGFTSSITPNVGEGQLVTCSY